VSVLEKEVTLRGSRGSVRCRALFDSGARYSIIRRDIAERISQLDPLQDLEDWVFETARAGHLVQAYYRIIADLLKSRGASDAAQCGGATGGTHSVRTA
jgi:hypothetical protein